MQYFLVPIGTKGSSGFVENVVGGKRIDERFEEIMIGRIKTSRAVKSKANIDTRRMKLEESGRHVVGSRRLGRISSGLGSGCTHDEATQKGKRVSRELEGSLGKEQLRSKSRPEEVSKRNKAGKEESVN